MQINDLIKYNDTIYRVVEVGVGRVLLIDCVRLTMPTWIPTDALAECPTIPFEKLLSVTNKAIPSIESLSQEQMSAMHRKFTLIAPILSYVADEHMRSRLIEDTAQRYEVSKQTIRKYLCLYLAYPNITVLAPIKKEPTKALTDDEKNFRWALNKYYYTRHKHSLRTAYLYMLKEKYTDAEGSLIDNHPTFRQFQYFYSKHKNLQTYYISRDGLTNYQRNHRPLLGEGVREFAPNIGVGMLDSTVCDIYLVNDSGEVVGRPILTACIDAYSGLCMGYYLGWEGGMYSLRGLMLNVISDKVAHCKNLGITITNEEWNCSELPATLVTDMGSEYKSESFEQLTELGVSVVNLNPYRPDLKSVVEKFFDCVQSLYKPLLKGKGVIEEDFQERGCRDYRKDACLTIEQFERVIINCILYYNNHRIIDLPLIDSNIKPYASALWKYGKTALGANLITVDKQTLTLCLLPRTKSRFTRKGLIVNKLRYKAEGFTKHFLKGGECTVAYSTDDVSTVWLVDSGSYIPFSLIITEFEGMPLEEIEALQTKKKAIIKAETESNTKARLALMESIQVISDNSLSGVKSISNIRATRAKETKKKHLDFLEDNNG